MTSDALDARRRTYFSTSSTIAAMADSDILALLDTPGQSNWWGTKRTLEIGGSNVFVKTVPVTDLEFANAFSTRNQYDLPLYYNYGVGSAGFGAFRELLTHTLTTNWVLEGSVATFPLLYAFRVLPFTGTREPLEADRRNGYVKYWGGSESVGRYLDDRLSARHELVLFLEHVPHTLHEWLVQHPSACVKHLDDLRNTISFLRSHSTVHFDAHFTNVLTDGDRTYLTDFGLALSRRFDLAADEQRFLAKHDYYDYGEVLWAIGYILVGIYERLSDDAKTATLARCSLTNPPPPRELLSALVSNVEQLAGTMELPDAFVACILKYRDVTLFMESFFWSMRVNLAKDTQLDHARLRQLLEAVTFV